MGTVGHALLEAVGRGDFDDIDEDDVEDRLQRSWDAQIAEMQVDIQQAWPMGSVPPPERWPGYQLTRVRLMRLLVEQVVRRRIPHRGEARVLATEEWLEALPLCGRADRIEYSASGVELVDLKSGWTLLSELQASHRRQLLFYAYLWNQRTGEWPTRASVQRLDGTRLAFEVNSAEAEEVVSEALVLLNNFNQVVESGSSLSGLGNPSTSTCRYCEFRPACARFFSAISEEWGWYLKSVLGRVKNIHNAGRFGVIELLVEGGNLSEEVKEARLVGLPPALLPKEGWRISIVDAIPTRVPGGLRASWETQLWVWD